MAIKEFAVRHGTKGLLRVVGRMSDRDLEHALSLAEKLAPSEFAKSVMRTLGDMSRDGHPTVELLRRSIRSMSPHVRDRMVNSLLIKGNWYGGPRRAAFREQGMTVPWTLLFSPTMRCNLRCPGCYSGTYDVKDEMGFEVLDRLVSEAEHMGIYLQIVLGGEPFVRDDMLEIYRRHNDVLFQVFTNGTMITPEVARKLERAGNVLVIFSVDGFEEETDARRGRGIFRKVMDGMDTLRETGVPYGFSSMVTSRNVETIVSDEFNDMLVDKGCLVGWHFLYMAVGRDPDISLMPTPQQRELLLQRGAPRIRQEKPLWVIDFWNDAPYVGGCIAGGRNYLHINAHGDVEPCIFVHLAVDNIKDKHLWEALDSPFFNGIRARQPYNHNLLRPCMIIDHPEVLRELNAEFKPYPTDGDASVLLDGFAGRLDEYARQMAEVMDPVWEREFVAKNFEPNLFTRQGKEVTPAPACRQDSTAKPEEETALEVGVCAAAALTREPPHR